MFQVLSEDSIFRLFHLDHDIGRKLNLCPVDEYYSNLRKLLGIDDSEELQNDWFRDGIDCEIIPHSGSKEGWVSGTIRMRAAFFSDDLHINTLSKREPDWIVLQNKDTILMPDIVHALGMSQSLFLNEDLLARLRSRLGLTEISSYRYAWFDYGIPCQVLIVGQGVLEGWLNGRIRLQIEFKANTEVSSIEPSLDAFRESP